MATCTLDILTETNYLTDWFVDNNDGTYAIIDTRLDVLFSEALTPTGGGAHIFRFVDVPRAAVLAGIALDAEFGYESSGLVNPREALVFSAFLSVLGNTSTRRRGAVSQVGSGIPPYWRFEAAGGNPLTSTFSSEFMLDSGSTYGFHLELAPGGGDERLIPLGLGRTEGSAPTIPAGDPLTIRIDLSARVDPSSGSNPDIHAWIGTPVLRDYLSGDPIEIEGLQHCAEPCGCLPHVCPELVDFDIMNRTISPNSWGGASSGPTYTRGPGICNGSAYVNGSAAVMQNGPGPTFSLETESVDMGIAPGSDFAAEVWAGLSSDTEILAVGLSFDESSVICGWGHDLSGDSEIRLQPGGGPPIVAPISNTFWSTVNNVAVFKVQRKGGILYFKLWDSDKAEPGWQLATVDTGTPSPGDEDQLTVSMNNEDLAGGQQVAFTLIRTGEACAEPTANQPRNDELIGIGDGSTTVFTTRYPYNPQTIEVEVDGDGEDFHPTDWRTGSVTMLTAPALGLEVRASYLRAEFLP